jgi:hypothetical protein
MEEVFHVGAKALIRNSKGQVLVLEAADLLSNKFSSQFVSKLKKLK